MMTVFFNFIQIEVTWLDELAEGLRNVIATSHNFRNWIDNLPAALKWKASKISPFSCIIELMRQTCYTLGVVAHQLILPKEKEDPEKKEEEAKEKREGKKVDLSKLDML